MVLGTELTSAERSHWPIHGPHALANTVAPMDSRSANRPSRSMVARICSLPGVISNSVLARKPLADACRAIDAARVMSSYDELVHEPTSAEEMLRGQLFSRAAAPTPAPTACARSGECGPLMRGVNSERLISIMLSYVAPSSARRSLATRSAAAAMDARPVALRYADMLESYPNTEHVAPISAPILQIVALPVAEIESAPGP